MQQLVLDLAPAQAPTLANFLPGRNGTAVQALERALAGAENCVYLWGPPGSGKSHLLRAFAAAAREGVYLDARHPDWTLAESSQAAAVDDIGLLDESGQIAAFDLYNRLRAARGAFVASGDAPPTRLALRPDISSRLASGVILPLRLLTDEEKVEALRERAKTRGMALGEDVIRYLLTHVQRDMGTQIRVLDALDRHSLETQRPVSVHLLKETLKEVSKDASRDTTASPQAPGTDPR